MEKDIIPQSIKVAQDAVLSTKVDSDIVSLSTEVKHLWCDTLILEDSTDFQSVRSKVVGAKAPTTEDYWRIHYKVAQEAVLSTKVSDDTREHLRL